MAGLTKVKGTVALEIKSPNIESLKLSKLPVGCVVMMEGYYNKDKVVHKRFISETDDGTGVLLNNGLWANIVINGKACVDWFGAKGDGVADDWWAIDKAINASISTKYLGSWEATSNRNPKFSVYMGRKTYRVTKQILLPPYMHFYGLGNRWYFSGTNHTKLVPDFTNPMQFAVQSANYVVDTGELIGHGYFSGVIWMDTKRMTATHGIKTYGYSIEPKNQILGGVRLVGSPTSKIHSLFINKIDCGIILNCSWCSSVDARTEHIKFGVYSGQDGNNSHIDGYYTGGTGTPLVGNPYLNPIESLDPSTGLHDQKVSEPNSKIGAIFYWSQGTTSTNLTCEGNDISLATAKGGVDIRCLYTEKNKSNSITAYNSQITIGEITGANDVSTFCLGVNNNITVEKDTQTGVTKRFQFVSQYSNRINVPLLFKEYTRGISVNGHNFSNITVNSTTGSDNNVGSPNAPVKTLNRALELIRVTYERSDRAILNSGSRRINITDTSTYSMDYAEQVRGGEVVISSSAGRSVINFNRGLRVYGCSLFILDTNITRGTNDWGGYDQSCLWVEGGTSTITIGNSDSTISKYGLFCLRENYSGMITLSLNNVKVSAPSESYILNRAYQNNSGHLVSFIKFNTTYSGGIESRPDKGLDVNTGTIIHSLGT